MTKKINFPSEPSRFTVGGAPEGYDALILAGLFETEPGRAHLHVARDDARMALLADALAFFAPALEVATFPAWDCVPYDRISPHPEIVGRRIDTLTRLLEPPGGPRIVLATVNALVQRVPARASFADASLALRAGGGIDVEGLLSFLARNGYLRTETVMEPGEHAVRGGLIDVFAPNMPEPVRLDLFGDRIEKIRRFDPATQRSRESAAEIVLKPVNEIVLAPATIERFCTGYRALFGAVTVEDALYEAVSAGQRHPGIEHWLPLFYESLETLLDYLPGAGVTFDHQANEVLEARLDTIADHYAARLEHAKQPGRVGLAGVDPGETICNPVPPERLYLDQTAWDEMLSASPVGALSPFAPAQHGAGVIDAGGRPGRDFGDARARPDVNLYEAVAAHIAKEATAGRRRLVATYTAGSRDRLAGLLAEHGLVGATPVDGWAEAAALGERRVAVAVLGLERGFVAPGLCIVAEQDILGERLARTVRRQRRAAEQFFEEASELNEGDLVVHRENGIGRYDGLETLSIDGAAHDCLKVVYGGGDKLFVPVENIEVLSRYGSKTAGIALDRLGSASWQARKARLKGNILEMADRLIELAAAREIKRAPEIRPPEGLYDEFCARFPFTETEDQVRAIHESLGDLGAGRPMDRLICGDVGFGKTEVALRTAFATTMSGAQVAVVVPTTLLCRQHYVTFQDRFQDLPVQVEQLSRLVPARKAAEVRKGLAEGKVDIVIGTHALLSKNVRFADLGLLVVDEEQHFGVAHKERLKRLKEDIHVLTLTATPIPRTLQLALTGVRDMSLIATPPVDRLAVRTFVLPFDPVIVREAILRERFRGGQSFYVCPRIEDLGRVKQRLDELVPEVNVVIAHGQLPARELESVMIAFSEGKYDVLVSTNIIESGLDMPSVNTMVIHRADLFGLAQLYQLRGRIGRAKVRAYAYLTLPANQRLSPAAEKRLQVMQSLDSLGAGFTLASYDLDIRGAGNLLGAEQSGHIREVGIELYQQTLEESVSELRGETRGAAPEDFSPTIQLGTPVLIPEAHVPDLGVRLGLYRRIAQLADRGAIEAFAAEMIDRFGSLPPEVENLLKVVAIKQLCRSAGVERVEAGPKGAVFSFNNNDFANPAGLVDFITRNAGAARLRPDHKLVYVRRWAKPDERLAGVTALLQDLISLAAAG